MNRGTALQPTPRDLTESKQGPRLRPSRALLGVLVLSLLASPDAFALNNCTGPDFNDLRSRRNVNVNVVPPFRYSPSCLKIAVNTTVTYNADFGVHPLFGGVVSGGIATPDPASPIGMHNNGSNPVIVAFPALGEFPYFCDFHFGNGMLGSIKVVPEFFSDGFE